MNDSNNQTSQQKKTIPAKQNQIMLVFINFGLFLAVFGLVGFAFYQNWQLQNQLTKYKKTSEENQVLPSTDGSNDPSNFASAPSKSIEPTEESQVNPVPDPFQNWQTYQNQTYGFSFKYPTNFNKSESPHVYHTLFEEAQLNLIFTQDVYTQMAQTPTIKVTMITTEKSVDEVVADLEIHYQEMVESLADSEGPYQGAEPTIDSISQKNTSDFTFTEIERFAGPGAPNAQLLEYYVKFDDKLLIFTANYGTYNPDVDQKGLVEKETVSKIIKTLKLLD